MSSVKQVQLPTFLHVSSFVCTGCCNALILDVFISFVCWYLKFISVIDECMSV